MLVPALPLSLGCKMMGWHSPPPMFGLAWYFAALHNSLSSLSAQVSNVDVGWTLGYMLNLTNMIPSETPQKVAWLPKSKWIAATVILATTVILIFCLIVAVCYWKDSSGYESL